MHVNFSRVNDGNASLKWTKDSEGFVISSVGIDGFKFMGVWFQLKDNKKHEIF